MTVEPIVIGALGRPPNAWIGDRQSWKSKDESIQTKL